MLCAGVDSSCWLRLSRRLFAGLNFPLQSTQLLKSWSPEMTSPWSASPLTQVSPRCLVLSVVASPSIQPENEYLQGWAVETENNPVTQGPCLRGRLLACIKGVREELCMTHRERCCRQETKGAPACRLYRCSTGSTVFPWLKRDEVQGMAPANSPHVPLSQSSEPLEGS